MLGRHEGVTETGGQLVRRRESVIEFPGRLRLPLPCPGLLRETVQLALGGSPKLCYVDAGLLKDRYDDALVIGQQGREKVGVVNHRVAPIRGHCHGPLHHLCGLECQTI